MLHNDSQSRFIHQGTSLYSIVYTYFSFPMQHLEIPLNLQRFCSVIELCQSHSEEILKAQLVLNPPHLLEKALHTMALSGGGPAAEYGCMMEGALTLVFAPQVRCTCPGSWTTCGTPPAGAQKTAAWRICATCWTRSARTSPSIWTPTTPS